MKILQVNKFYYPHRGAERYYFGLSKLLETKGHQIVPFAMADVKNLPSPYQDYFVKKMDLSRPGWNFTDIKKIRDIIYNRGAQAELAELLKDTHPEVAHLHNIYYHLSPSILPVLKYFRIPTVMTVHDFYLLSPNYSLFRRGVADECCKPDKYYKCVLHRCVKNSYGASLVGALEAYSRRRHRYFERNVDLFIAPSQFVKAKFVEWGWPAQLLRVVPHFVDSPEKLPKNKIGDYVLYLGALEPGKGLEQVLKMWYEDKIPFELRIVGDGSEHQHLEYLVEKYDLSLRVKLLGHLPDELWHKELAGCRFLLAPSTQYETFGLVVLEAYAAGKAVLVSNQGALPELVNSETGRIFNTVQKGALGQNLRAMWDDPNLIAKGARGWELVREKYTPELHYQRMLEIYEEVKQRRG